LQQNQGPDRNALVGILLISVILGVWLLFFSPRRTPEPSTVPTADSTAALDEEAGETPEEILAPTDSAFAGALSGTARLVVVESDRYIATFSTRGGTLVSFRLKDFARAGSTDRVDLVQDTARGALSLTFDAARGRVVDSRALFFGATVTGGTVDTTAAPGAGAQAPDTVHVADGPATLLFDAPVGDGTLRIAYTFEPESYLVGLEVSTPGTDVLARSGGYELAWNGAIPRAEADPVEESTNSGAYVAWGGDTDRLALTEPGEAEDVRAVGNVGWVAVKTKFFIAALLPGTGVAGEEAPTTEGAELEGVREGEPGEDGFGEQFTARLAMERPAEGATDAFRLYMGPMELRYLGPLGLYDTVEFGFGQAATRPIARYVVAPTFVFLKTFIPSYGLVIILFALIVKLVLWPLTASTFKNAARMRELAPRMEAIKERHADNQQKQQEETMKMYREAGVNPLGGCLPMLLQYPLLIALWRFFQSTLVLRQHDFLWAHDLSAPDVIFNLPFTIPLYGNFVAGFTLLMGLSMLAQMKLTAQPTTGANAGQMKVMMYMMPAIFFLFFNRLPAGLSLYYLSFNVFSIMQQQIVNKTTKPLAMSAVELKGSPRDAGGKRGGAVNGNGRASSNGRTTSGKRAGR